MATKRMRASRLSTEDKNIDDLVFRLQALLARSSSMCTTRVPTTSKILKETCSYIKRLHREVDDMSERLFQLLALMNTSGVDADILRALLKQ